MRKRCSRSLRPNRQTSVAAFWNTEIVQTPYPIHFLVGPYTATVEMWLVTKHIWSMVLTRDRRRKWVLRDQKDPRWAGSTTPSGLENSVGKELKDE
jgi:hypothetical protein